VVKNHSIAWLLGRLRSWSRRLPATSLAPVLTTALYLVLAASVLSGFRVAFSPSILELTVTAVICVVLPFLLTL
jgi:hypothetical protein